VADVSHASHLLQYELVLTFSRNVAENTSTAARTIARRRFPARCRNGVHRNGI
jgi:hypothetical protein